MFLANYTDKQFITRKLEDHLVFGMEEAIQERNKLRETCFEKCFRVHPSMHNFPEIVEHSRTLLDEFTCTEMSTE